MTGASLVCGNTVILKPSSDSPTIAAKFFEALEEAGMPPAWSTSAPVPAPRSATAWWSIPRRATSRSPARAMSAWISTARRAAPKGQIWIKRTVLEMGGKDTIVVDADADLDAAVRRRGRGGLRLPGAEVLGLLARHRAPGYLRRVPREAEGAASRRSRSALPEDNVRMGPVINEGAMKIDPQLHRDRQAGRPADHGRRTRAEATDISSSPR